MDKKYAIAVAAKAMVIIITAILGWVVCGVFSLIWAIPIAIIVATIRGGIEGPLTLTYKASPVLLIFGCLNPILAVVTALVAVPAMVAFACSLTWE